MFFKFVLPMPERIKALLIDDEIPACQTLVWLLAEYCPEVMVSGMAHSATEANTFLQQHATDFLFLDISMPGVNGFEFLQSLPANKYPVVFITAHNEFAIRAFREAAVDYLLKPVDPEELKQAVQKVNLRLQSPSADYFTSLQGLLQTLNQTSKNQRIAVAHIEGIHFVTPAEIVYLEADSNYTVFHMQSGNKIVASKTMGDFEMQLPGNFFRIHKSFLINLERVIEFIKKDGNSVLMSDGALLPVSRRKVQELMQALLTS